MTLHVAIPELPAAAADSAAVQARLPALGKLLAGARRRLPEPGWRGGLLRDLAPANMAAVAPAAVAAAALPALGPAAAFWFAQPVHQTAGMSRVHLHPEGVLRLRPEECSQLAEAFTRDLGGAAGTLHALGDGLLFGATSPVAMGSEDEDPINWCGRELDPAHPPLPAVLRRLEAEIEMWLYGLPLNRERERRAALPVTRLWLWGGARSLPRIAQVTAAATASWPAMGADPFLLGLAALGVCAAPDAQASFAQRAVPGRGVVVVGMPALAGRVDLQALDAGWFAPLCSALEEAALDEVLLHFAGSRWQLRRPGRMRRWWLAMGRSSKGLR
ncbi:MAG: hypothetical protein QM696_01865 [Steroidobacteraceae bacterium]